MQERARLSRLFAASKKSDRWMNMTSRASMKRLLVSAALGAVLAGPLAGCAAEVINHGYILDETALEKIKPGASVETVLQTLGTPSTVSTVGNKTFYYISQVTTRRVQFLEPKITDQRVLAVYFNKGFKVEKIANYGLQDGEVFDFISRTTPTSGQERSFVRQLFRGLSPNPLMTGM
jgi:outer membrane protein assembly factor BamE (lipoprotein component of BamABCDE complex)